jgi:hypothetical protein
VDILSFLRRNCCFAPRSLIPLFHSGPLRRIFPNARPVEVPCATSFLVLLFRGLRYPTVGRWYPDWSSCALTVPTARDYILQLTITHTMVQSRLNLSIHGNGFQRRTFPFLWVPELFLASTTRLQQQQLSTTEPQRLSSSLTYSVTNPSLTPSLFCLKHFGTDHIENTAPLLQCNFSIDGQPPSNGHYIVAFFAVVA